MPSASRQLRSEGRGCLVTEGRRGKHLLLQGNNEQKSSVLVVSLHALASSPERWEQGEVQQWVQKPLEVLIGS